MITDLLTIKIQAGSGGFIRSLDRETIWPNRIGIELIYSLIEVTIRPVGRLRIAGPRRQFHPGHEQYTGRELSANDGEISPKGEVLGQMC